MNTRTKTWLLAGATALAAVLIIGSLQRDGGGADTPRAETNPEAAADDAASQANTRPGQSGGRVTLTGRVTRVVDGDTIRVETRGFETTVRLIGIDAPETRKPGAPVQCFGPQASERAKALLTGQQVRLIGDPTQDVRDRYNRLLAYVYVGDAKQSVNQLLVEGGFARVYVYTPSGPFVQTARFRAAETRARNAHRGLWGTACHPRSVPAT